MIVLKFGVLEIVEGEKAAEREMRDAHRLYNCLVAIERWRRQEFADIRSRCVPGLSEVEASYEQISEWIGEHSGTVGERGAIREKRQEASVVALPPGKKSRNGNPFEIVPTKRVDDAVERDSIEVLKAWRSQAGKLAKERREEFEHVVSGASLAFESRTRGVPLEWLEERGRLRLSEQPTDKEALKKLNALIESSSRKTHAKRAANLEVLGKMLEEDWPEAWKSLARLDATADELQVWVGQAHTLNHGTYSAVSDDVERAGKRPKPRPDGEPRPPRKRPVFSTAGRRKMGWQIGGGGVTWGDVLEGECNCLKIDSMTKMTCGGYRYRAVARIRVSKLDRGVAEWVKVLVTIHRPIPPDTLIKWVYLVPAERPGPRWEYSLQLTADPTEPLIQRAAGKGHVHIELRWTQCGDTLDVASINGMPLVLPGGSRGIVSRLRFADHLRGLADRFFDVARDEIRGWMARLEPRLDVLPPHLRKSLETIPHWRRHQPLRRVSRLLADTMSEGKSLAVWRAWCLHRKPDKKARGEDMFVTCREFMVWAGGLGLSEEEQFLCWMETWRHKDEHLERMSEGTARTARAARKDFYRVTAARLSEQFATYSFGGAVDLAALALRDKAEDPPAEMPQAIRRNRVLAAASELKESIEHSFGKERHCERPGVVRDPGGARSSSGTTESVVAAVHAE